MDKEDKVLKIKDSEKNTKGISPEMDALLEDIESAPPQKSKRTYKRKPKVVNKDLKKAEAGDLSEKELKYQDFFKKSQHVQIVDLKEGEEQLTEDLVENKEIEQKIIVTKISNISSDVSVKHRLRDVEDVEGEVVLSVKPRGKRFFKLLLLLGMLAAATYLGFWYGKKQMLVANQNMTLADIAILPDEVPQLYKITGEAEILKNPLFSKVSSEDMIYFFPNNKKVFIYREGSKKVVDIIDLAENDKATESETANAATTTATSTIKLEKSTTTKATSTTTKSK